MLTNDKFGQLGLDDLRLILEMEVKPAKRAALLAGDDTALAKVITTEKRVLEAIRRREERGLKTDSRPIYCACGRALGPASVTGICVSCAQRARYAGSKPKVNAKPPRFVVLGDEDLLGPHGRGKRVIGGIPGLGKRA